jgi:eukaryotic-like serine/threonine-protein kinase
MSEPSAVPANTAEATRDVQVRLGRFARTLSVLSSIMLLASMANALVASSGAAPISTPSRLAHISATALALAVWRLTLGKTLRLSTIHTLDGALTVTLCACWALLGQGISPSEPIEFSIILATTYTLIARSVVVPSSFARTLVLGAVSIVPTLVFFHTRQMSFVAHAPSGQVRTFLMFATLWCGVAVVTAALQSRLLFGLRQRIREAAKLGQYTLQEKIGEGGMGAVYRATHAMLRRPAAIKLLLPGRAGEREIARFEREVQLTSRLRHPNTISIFDYGRTADGTFYYVMELLDGFDLDSLVEAEGPLPPWRVIRILSQASGALIEAHGLELIHRDIKPANILLTERSDETDIVKVVDFGLVKSLGGTANETAATATQANVITGTPLYLAPEAISAPDSVDARADIYALGAVGFFLLTGQHVFEGRTVVEVCSKHLLEPPMPPSQRSARPVPPELDALILACLAKSPDGRPPSSAALKQALDALAVRVPHDLPAAQLWWQERAPALRAQRVGSEQAPPQTSMTVDLLARALQV